MNDKVLEKLRKEIDSKLSVDQRRLFTLIKIEAQKPGAYTFRMPLGLISLDSVWEHVVATCNDMKIGYVKAGLYATLEELDDILGDVEWIWDKWIPKGFNTMVVGDPGVGKSILVLDFIKCITNKLSFPIETIKPKKVGNVIWIDTEATQQLLNIRAKRMLVDRSRVHIPVIDGDMLSQADIGVVEHREQIINLVEAIKPEALVLDSLGGAHSRGENKTEDIKPVMEFLALLARDYKMASIIIHHLNKGHAQESPEVSLYRIRGSTVIPALARSIIALERVTDETNRMRVMKSNLAHITSRHTITVLPQMDKNGDIMTFEYKPYEPPPAKHNKKEKCAAWVMNMLEKHGGSIDLADLVSMGEGEGYSRQNLYAAKDVLEDRIFVTGTGRQATWNINKLENDTQSIDKITKGIKNNGK